MALTEAGLLVLLFVFILIFLGLAIGFGTNYNKNKEEDKKKAQISLILSIVFGMISLFILLYLFHKIYTLKNKHKYDDDSYDPQKIWTENQNIKWQHRF